jgi:hypothetical protein
MKKKENGRTMTKPEKMERFETSQLYDGSDNVLVL